MRVDTYCEQIEHEATYGRIISLLLSNKSSTDERRCKRAAHDLIATIY